MVGWTYSLRNFGLWVLSNRKNQNDEVWYYYFRSSRERDPYMTIHDPKVVVEGFGCTA